MPQKTTKIGNLIRPLIITAAGLLLVLAINRFFHVDIGYLTKDVFVTARIPSFIGILSNLGSLGWFSSGLLAAFALRAGHSQQEGQPKKFLMYAGLLSAWLFIDDFFMFHDFWLDVLVGGKGYETAYFAVLGLAAAALNFVFWDVISKFRPEVYLTAALMLAGSLIADVFEERLESLGSIHYLLEDGLKWTGICFWASYFWSFSSSHLSTLRERTPTRDGVH